jgi:hypothetical protein
MPDQMEGERDRWKGWRRRRGKEEVCREVMEGERR